MAKYDVVVIGGGPAGIMAGYHAFLRGLSVAICDGNDMLAKKILVTGKGRCNVTNNTDCEGFLSNIPRGKQFMYSSIYGFTPSEAMDFFECIGVPLKTERGNRVFPVSDKAGDIRTALEKLITDCGIKVFSTKAEKIITKDNAVTGVKLKGGNIIDCNGVVLATGGLSYPNTGSTGDGYKMAKELGHKLVNPVASLVSVTTKEKYVAELMGLSLKNVTLKLVSGGKVIYEELGEMLFTHYGLSGPLVLSASAHIGDGSDYKFVIDLKPGLSTEQLDSRLLRDFELFKNRDFANALSKLLPAKLIPEIIKLSGIDEGTKVNSITKKQRQDFVHLIKNLTLTYSRKRPVAEAVITRGGIPTGEINPKNMESKIIKNLHFAGEIMDVDGYTGGFNLQVAYSTGVSAGNGILKG